jgi:hypothetical protein
MEGHLNGYEVGTSLPNPIGDENNENYDLGSSVEN